MTIPFSEDMAFTEIVLSKAIFFFFQVTYTSLPRGKFPSCSLVQFPTCLSSFFFQRFHLIWSKCHQMSPPSMTLLLSSHTTSYIDLTYSLRFTITSMIVFGNFKSLRWYTQHHYLSLTSRNILVFGVCFLNIVRWLLLHFLYSQFQTACIYIQKFPNSC